MITPQNYLDLGHLFFFEIVGDFTLAFILGLVFIAYAGVRWRIPLEVSILGVLLWTGAVVSYAYNAFWWMLILLLFGLIIYAFLPRIIKRG